jgi:tetratricopeptide (TPR) repeat protein
MNAGLPAAGNLQFIYPGTHYLGHNGEYAPWPVDAQGRDLSFYENNNFGTYKSYHVFGQYTDFFGGYWHDQDFGMARYSTHDDKAGKKIWIWGLSRQGMIWDKVLTDSSGQYVEVQSGRLFNQASPGSSFTPFKNLNFIPYGSDGWQEYWFPVRGTKGFVKANDYGALNLKKENGYLKVYFSPLQALRDTLTVFEKDKPMYARVLDLQPMQPFADSVRIDAAAGDLVARLGQNKLVYHANPEADVLQRPLDFPKDFNWQSAYGLYVQGRELSRQKQYGPAWQKIAASLQKEPFYGPALAEAAHLHYRNRQYAEALDFAKKALSLDTYDPAANYQYALANLQLGNTANAKDGFDLAAFSPEFRVAAYTELSKLYLREGNPQRAATYAQKSLDYNRGNLEAYQLLAVIGREGAKPAEAAGYLETLQQVAPLHHFVRFEKYWMNQNEKTKHAFTSLIRGELPHESYMELAIWYYNLNRINECLAVLQLAPAAPETLYWQAYLGAKRGQNPEGWLRQAQRLSPYLAFPHRTETADVLGWVISRDNTWKPKYFLALIHWNRQDTLAAKELLTACGTEPDFAPFYLTRAELLVRRDAPAALKDYLKAEKLDPKQWRTGLAISQFYAGRKAYAEAQQYARKYYRRFPDSYILGSQYAKTLLLAGQYQASLDVLSRLRILPYEGATDGRMLYREANLMLANEALRAGKYADATRYIAQSRAWNEHLGAGKPYPEDLDERLEDYLEAVASEKLGQREKATALYTKIVAFKNPHPEPNALFTALALRQLGKEAEAEALMNDWLKKSPENLVARWCYAFFKGEKPPALAGASDNANLRLLVKCSESLTKG